MKPQKEKDLKPSTINKLGGNAEKKIVPQNILARKCSVIYQPNDFSREYTCDVKPIKFFPEWNEKEVELLNSEFEKIMAEPEGTFPKFEDPDSHKINLPHSIQSEGNFNIKWLRPEKYIIENLLDREIKKRHPDVNNIKLREQFKEIYAASLSPKKGKKNRKKVNHRKTLSPDFNIESIEESPDPVSQNANKLIPKDFIELLANPVDIKIVSVIEVEETDEEFEKRTLSFAIANSEENKKKTMKNNQYLNVNNHNAGNNLHGGDKNKQLNNNNNKQQGHTIEPEVKTKLILKHCVHPDINIQDRYADYSQWVASIFQMIKDRNIHDAYTSENIFQKIYPQKDGVPVYNPHGKYWIKLYYMGKLRRVEIDDTMPCSKYDEFLLPKTENFGEIWPALITKALIKLYSHKFCATFEEIGDCSIVYSLTAHVAEKISLNKLSNANEEKLTKILTILSAVLKDENYKKCQPILLAFAKSAYDLNKEAEIKAKILEKKFKSKGTMNEFDTRKFDDDNVPIMSPPKANRLSKRFSTTKALIPIYDMVPSKSFSQKPEVGTYQNMIYDFVNQSYANMKKSPESIEHNKKNERIHNKIFLNCLYSVIELFDNDNFNMKRLKPLDFTDLREKIGDYLKAPLKQLSLDDKKIYIQKLKELKAKQKEEKLKRIEELKPEGRRIRLIKIKNTPDLNLEHLFVPYTNEEIEMTKKCLLNQWDFPPPSFLNKVFNDKLVAFKLSSTNVNENHENTADHPHHILHHDLLNMSKDSLARTSKNSWAYENYLGLINNNLEKYEASKELMKRDDGSWISLNEFCSLFNNFVVLYNPRNFRSSLNFDSNWYNYDHDIYEHNSDYCVFRLNPKLEAIDQHTLKTYTKHSTLNNKTDSNKSCVVIMFNANTDSRMDLKDSNYYMLFDIYDKNQNLIEKNLKVTNYNMAVQYDGLEFNQEYFIHLKGGLYSMGFYLSIMSDHIVENISYANYLKNYCDYFSQTYKLSHKPLEKNKASLLMRLRINNRNEDTKLFFNLNGKCYSDNYFLKFFDFYLVQGKNTQTKKIYCHDICNLPASTDNYYIILTVTPPYNIQDNQFEFEVLSSSHNITVENLERIETSELGDVYTPNKHGIIFKELIYAADKSYTTFSINVSDTQNLNMSIPDRRDSRFNNQEFTTGSPLSEKRRREILDKSKLVLELYDTKDGSLKFKSDFFHSILIPNLVLDFESQIQANPLASNITSHTTAADNKKNLKDNTASLNTAKPFLLICYFHASEFPNCLNIEKTQDLSWLIRVFSSDSLVFVRDTSKEDSEKALKESWEQKEPGRAERAKISRVKYVISQKIEKNQALNEEEENFLKEERERRFKADVSINNNQKEENKGNKAAVTSDKKNKNQNANTVNKAQTPLKSQLNNADIKTLNHLDLDKDPINNNLHIGTEKNVLHFDNKPMPTSDKHVSSYVKNFLNYSCEKRTKIFDNKLIEDEKILCDEKKREEIKEKINRENENYLQTKIKTTEQDKLSMMNETFKAFYEINQHHKIDQEETKILFRLKDDSKKMISKKDAEKKLLAIIQNKENDLNACIQSYKEIAGSCVKSELLEIVHDLISKKKEEFIKFELKKNEKNPKELKLIAQKYLEDLYENKWKLSNEIISRLNEFMNK